MSLPGSSDRLEDGSNPYSPTRFDSRSNFQSSSQGTTQRETTQNLLWIVLDTVRKDHLGPYGYDRDTTPTLDAFADSATTFESAIAPAPWTLPVHASMFTGRYPTQHGATQERPYLDDDVTLAEILALGGYETACYSSNAWITPYTGLTRGFDDHDAFFDAMPGDFLSAPLSRVWQFVNDSDRLRTLAASIVHLGAQAHNHLEQGESTDTRTPAVIDRTMSHIAGAAGPWFAFLNLMDAHLPYVPPDAYRQRFAPGVDPREVCQHAKEFNAGVRDIDADEWADMRALYDAEIAHMDAEVGRLLEWMDLRGHRENTTVIVCADHGELLGEHDLLGHEFAVYEELVNVPLLVDHPDLPTGRRDDLVELLDLYHTILDVVGLDIVRSPRPAVGLDRTRSLLSSQYRDFSDIEHPDPGQRAINEHDDPAADYAFIEYATPLIELHHLERKAANAGITLPDDHPAYSSIRAARGTNAKYIRPDRNPPEGYRIDDDPGESTPIQPNSDPAVNAAKQALNRFVDAISGAQAMMSATSPADPSTAEDRDDPLADADQVMHDRLRDLGYID